MANVVFGDLLTFAGEVASPDSSGATATREFVYWINAALARLYAEQSWNHTLGVAKITIVPEEAATGIAINKGAVAFTIGSDLLAKYVDDKWDFHIDAEPDQSFRVQTKVDADNGVMEAQDIWIQANLSGGTGSWHKTVYDLPDNAKEIYSVRLMQTRDQLVGVIPHKFDVYRIEQPKEVGFPRIYTLRDNKIEIWPAPSSDYYSLTISYRKAPARYTTATATTTEIDWPQEWEDLVQKAIQVEAAITLGEDSPIPYMLAKSEFEERLENYKALDSKKDTPSGPMQLQHPTVGGRRFAYDYGYGDGPLTDIT